MVGGWEGGGGMTKGCYMGGSNSNNSSTTPGVRSSGGVVCFRAGDTVRIWGEIGRVNCGGYTELSFFIFAWGYLLVLLRLSSFSSSLSTGAGTNKDFKEGREGVQ